MKIHTRAKPAQGLCAFYQLLWTSKRLGEISKIQLWWTSQRLSNNCQNSTVAISTTVEVVQANPLSTRTDNANLIN
ncbi:hypothetical protein ABX042_10410 [Snodgrassella alvi]|uniref:hypothetical protein n=1 Tax=Snodgrassella alvi TaxID=1196083 RepID=UPI00351C2261